MFWGAVKASASEMETTKSDTRRHPQKQMNDPMIQPKYVLGQNSPYPTVVIVTTIFQRAVNK